MSTISALMRELKPVMLLAAVKLHRSDELSAARGILRRALCC